MPKFSVLIRAVRQLTAELIIEAADSGAAEDEAKGRLRMPGIDWTESEPWDQQVECVEKAD